MPNSAVRFSFSALVVLGMFLNAASQTPPKSMRASEVIALQAGGVLPGSVAHDIAVRGLNFRPDDDYRTLLKALGARCDGIGCFECCQGDSDSSGWEAGQGVA